MNGWAGLIISFLICLGAGYLVVRLLVLRARRWRGLIGAIVPVLFVAALFAVLAGFTSSRQAQSLLPLESPLAETLADVAREERANRYVLVEAVVSAENQPGLPLNLDYFGGLTPLPVELRLSLPDGDLILDSLRIDSAYRPNDAHPSLVNAGDTVIVFGHVWLADQTYYILGDLLVVGNYDQFLTSYSAQLQRSATYAQIGTVMSLLFAIIITLTPIYQAMHIWREGRGL